MKKIGEYRNSVIFILNKENEEDNLFMVKSSEDFTVSYRSTEHFLSESVSYDDYIIAEMVKHFCEHYA